ncbi:MAG: hypothetical protein GXX85_00060, partial [Ignavibacteria bacterium]|nr:hypothetical protein [Ignavibacteria bacterium]
MLPQNERDSLIFNNLPDYQNLILSKFNKVMKVASYNSILNYNLTSGNFSAGINEKFNSIITETSKSIKDESRFLFFTEYLLLTDLKIGTKINHELYSENRQDDNNNIVNISPVLYLSYSFDNNFKITPFGGYLNSRQSGETDEGLIYGGEFNATDYILEDFKLNSFLMFKNEDISPRKNINRIANVNIENVYSNFIKNNLYASYIQNRKDFYFSADSSTNANFNIRNNIQSRTEDIYSVSDKFKALIPEADLSIDLGTKIQWRDIKRNYLYKISNQFSSSLYDSRIEEFGLGFDILSEYNPGAFSAAVQIGYSETEENYIAEKPEGMLDYIFSEIKDKESRKTNSSKNINLSFYLNFPISQADLISMSLFHRKLLYDTPSSENFDDRDELLTIGRIMYLRKVSPYLNIFLNSEIGVNTLVYLFSERSLNNNIKRYIKFSAGSDFSAAHFSNSFTAEVSANYTTYKFEHLVQSAKSYSFRQLSIKDSLKIKLNEKLSFLTAGSLKLSEQGNFNWSDFSGKPGRYISEIFVEPKFRFSYDILIFDAGIRYFLRNNYDYKDNVTKKLVSTYSSYGPVSKIFLNMKNVTLSFNGW